jgi:DNA ligase-1
LAHRQIFDVPSMGDQPFEERIAHARKLFGKGGQYASMNRIKVLDQEVVKDHQHVIDKLKEVETLEGEGLMLRKPKS